MERPILHSSLRFVVAAGALVAASGCSEAVPPANEGGAFINWQGVAATCAQKGTFEVAVGKVDANEIIELKKDTVAGAKIYCRVTGGGTYTVEGDLQLGPTTLSVVANGVSPAATEDSPATGHVVYSAENTSGAVYTSPSETPCNFWFSGAQEVAPGRVWMQFNCPALVNAGTASTCGIQNPSTFAFQNCDQ